MTSTRTSPAPRPAADPAHLRRLEWLVMLVLLALFISLAALFSGYTCDDSYITYRYAEHAAAGRGLVFNPGERVEGYSNPLWLGLLVLALKAGLEVTAAAKVGGLLAALGALLLSAVIVKRLMPGAGALSALALLPLMGAGLAYYSVSGLETALYCCLLTGIVACWLRGGRADQWGVGLLALAAALTRPEGLAVMAVVLLGRLCLVRRLPPPQRSTLWLSSGAALILLALFLLWRHWYFGDLLPNTYYAKPPGAFGGGSLLFPLGYLRDFLLGTGAWLWLAATVALAGAKQWRTTGILVLLLAAVEVALVLHARGDWMALHRFLLPILPAVVACGYAELLRLADPLRVKEARWQTQWRLLLGTLLGAALLLNAVEIAQQLRDFRDGQYPQAVMAGQPQRQAGQWLRQHYPPQTVLACKRIGGISYYSGMRMIDVLGLTDRTIAMIRHRSSGRGETEQQAMAAEVFRRGPDLILLCAMKRWDRIPLDRPAPDLGGNLRDVDNALYAGLGRNGYRFVCRLPQGGSGELVVYERGGEGGERGGDRKSSMGGDGGRGRAGPNR